MPSCEIICGEALAELRKLPDASIDCVSTSPPYWRMRDYGHADQIGMENDVGDFIDRLADTFDEIYRVLVPTGTCWVNLGDSYIRKGGGTNTGNDMGRRYRGTPGRAVPMSDRRQRTPNRVCEGLKVGDLVGVPWMFAFECRRRGWYLRAENIWHKPNPTPDSCASRPGRAHEHVFLLTKACSPDYYYDYDAIRTPLRPKTKTSWGTVRRDGGNDPLGRVRASNMARSVMRNRRPALGPDGMPRGANRQSVWTIAVHTNKEQIEHYAMQAPKVAELAILAGCPPGGRVLDPFCGPGTTGLVARKFGRSFVGIELVAATADLARWRLRDDSPLFTYFDDTYKEIDDDDDAAQTTLFADPEDPGGHTPDDR